MQSKNAGRNAFYMDVFETEMKLVARKKFWEQCDKLVLIFEGFSMMKALY